MGRRGSFFFALTLAFAGVAQAAAGQPPVEAFGRLPLVSELALSPSGRYAAVAQTIDGQNWLLIYDMLEPKAKPSAEKIDELKIVDLTWKSDERLLVTGRFQRNFRRWIGKTELARVIAMNRDGSNIVMLMNNNATLKLYQYGVTDLLPNDPAHVLMAGYDGDTVNLFKVDVNTGRAERIERGRWGTDEYVTDKDGEARVRVDKTIYERDVEIFARPKSGSEWKKIAEYKRTANSPFEFAGISASDPNIAYVTAGNTGRIALHEFDLTTGQLGKVVFGHPKVDIMRPLFDGRTGALLGVRYGVDVPDSEYFDKSLQALLRGLRQALPNSTLISMASASADRKIMAIYAESTDDAGTYYILNRNTTNMSAFAQAYPDLSPADIGAVKAVSYPARDGVTVPAYLTLPPGSAGRNLPTVIMPHGGPESRDFMTFDWWAQFLANRGYAVLQPNFRGSSGYGAAWSRAGYGQWGGVMQHDVSDGVKYLVAQGIADPSRICIVGASYGGYAALAGATLTPELYACAVSVAGPSDLGTMLRWEKNTRGGSKGEAYTYWIESIALSEVDSDAVRRVSPARQAKAVRAPILLIHGEKDLVVPIAQSEDMDQALNEEKKPHKFVKLPGEDHYLSQQSTRVLMLKEIEAFLAENLHPH